MEAVEVVEEAEKEKLISTSCSQDWIGISGDSLVFWGSSLADWRVEIFLFFEEDVLTASCLGSSRTFSVTYTEGFSADADCERMTVSWWL